MRIDDVKYCGRRTHYVLRTEFGAHTHWCLSCLREYKRELRQRKAAEYNARNAWSPA